MKIRLRNFVNAGIFLLAAYLLSYVALSRYSYYRFSHGRGIFYYAPRHSSEIVNGYFLRTFHDCATTFYYPLWFVDHHVFGGPAYGGFSDCPQVSERPKP